MGLVIAGLFITVIGGVLLHVAKKKVDAWLDAREKEKSEKPIDNME